MALRFEESFSIDADILPFIFFWRRENGFLDGREEEERPEERTKGREDDDRALEGRTNRGEDGTYGREGNGHALEGRTNARTETATATAFESTNAAMETNSDSKSEAVSPIRVRLLGFEKDGALLFAWDDFDAKNKRLTVIGVHETKVQQIHSFF